jgi:hypothetical protein
VNQIRIGVKVPLAAAVAAGRSQYGYGSVTLADTDVASLSETARGMLREWDGITGPREDIDRRRGLVGIYDGQWTREVEVALADAPTVLAAIERAANAVQLKATRDHEESEARVEKALAAPDADWITSNGGTDTAYYTDALGAYSEDSTGLRHDRPSISLRGPSGYYLTDAERRDPRITARVQRLQGDVLAALLAAHDTHRTAWIAVRDAAEAKREARSETWRRACVDYVIRWVPEYAQAARDGSDVRRLARDTSVASCTEMLNSHGLETVEVYGEVDPHPRPHQRAYDALALVSRLMARAQSEEIAAASAGLVDSFATRIVRADTCDESSCTAGRRTCIEIQLGYIDGVVSCIYVYADSAPPHEHESDDEVSD